MAHIPVLIDLKLINTCILSEDGTNAIDINKLEHVDTTGVADGCVLSYNATAGKWKPTTPSSGGGSSVNHKFEIQRGVI